MKLKGLRVLVTGGSGRLGTELVSLLDEEGAVVSCPSSKQWDIREVFPAFLKTWCPQLIIHCAAFTDVPGAEKNKIDCINVNVFGTKNISELAAVMNSRLIHISSDYVPYRPCGFYAATKWMAEAFIPKEETIIRTSFKDRGTWGEEGLKGVFHPVYTNADWTDIIAAKIVEVIKKDLRGIVNVGTKAKTLRDLAFQEFPDVEEISVETADDILGYHYPRDCRMKLTI